LSLCEFRECNDAKQINRLSAELLGSEPRAFEAVIDMEYFKRRKSLSTIKLPIVFFKKEVEEYKRR